MCRDRATLQPYRALVSFKNARDQRKFMHSLTNLKGIEQFKGLNIKDDYTTSERNIIKDYVMKAKAKSEMEDGFVWKVRGNPRNGLFLKRILKPNKECEEVTEKDENVPQIKK